MKVKPGLAARLERRYRERLERRRRECVEALLRVVKSGVLEEHGARLIVFGSMARGDYDEHSDLDLVVADGKNLTA